MLILRIDPHVHCRDGKQAYKETIKHACELAKAQKIDIIFDMPNTDPPVIWKEDVEKRTKIAKKGNCSETWRTFVGLTSDPSQVGQAVNLVKTNPFVIGLKLYAGKSVGGLAVIEEEKQNLIYKTLAKLDYRGVLALHCEKEKLIKGEIWNPEKPITHCLARPPEAEIESVKDQIKFAKTNNFKGILHICHISCPESVELVQKARKNLKITCAVSPHHILFTEEKMNEKNGLLYKVNPPLRDSKRVEKLRDLVKKGFVDWIETDHAPHTLDEKLKHPFLSGIPSLNHYGEVLNFLNLNNKQIQALTSENIINAFNSWNKKI